MSSQTILQTDVCDGFSKRLNRLINEREISQVNLATVCQMAPSAINNYTQGRIPKAGELLRIAKHFGVSMEWLLTGEIIGVSSDGNDHEDFTQRTDAIREKLNVSRLREVWEFIGIGKGTLFVSRSGSRPISRKTWQKLASAERRLDPSSQSPKTTCKAVASAGASLPVVTCPMCQGSGHFSLVEWEALSAPKLRAPNAPSSLS